MQAHGPAYKLMDLHAFWNILEHSGTFWNILHAFINILEHSACILEHSGTFWNILDHLQYGLWFSNNKECTQMELYWIAFPFLYCLVLFCTVLYCFVLFCTVLYCIVLYCTVLYCLVLSCTDSVCVHSLEFVNGTHTDRQTDRRH